MRKPKYRLHVRSRFGCLEWALRDNYDPEFPVVTRWCLSPRGAARAMRRIREGG